MFAVGSLTGRRSAASRMPIVMLVHDGQKIEYVLVNEEAMPQWLDGIGLFQFELADQFCYWLDANGVKAES